MNYGFLVDNRKCIGCHACSTACKSENEVPLGVNRTWVKYVETGAFPNTRRHFQVTRCNHCANPPCVRICPVTAMYQRDDGIVEFNPDICIGCKACMQACPYDAIYLDPESNTVAKCHFCAHRTELALEPACVIVCPVHAIVAGDLNNPDTEIARMISGNRVTVRKPEQGTAPKLFYIEGNDISMVPTATERTPESFLWADVLPLHGAGDRENGHGKSESPMADYQSLPSEGPIQLGGRISGHMVQVAYNAQHKIPWHWPVPAYLVTKGIGSGLFMLLSIGSLGGWFDFDALTYLVGGFISLLFIAITTGLLVHDLGKPKRFFSIVLRPQWRSWLTRGAYLLIGFSAVAGLWWLSELAVFQGWLLDSLGLLLRQIGMWLGLPLAVGAAVYTAYLFGQAEGRDLWQSPLLPLHMFVQALMAGSGALLLTALAIALPDDILAVARLTLVAMLVLDLAVTLLGELGMPHASDVAAKAAHEIRHGRYKNHFWGGSMLLGHLVPLGLLFVPSPLAVGLAALSTIAGLYFFEYAFVMAPQEIPNS